MMQALLHVLYLSFGLWRFSSAFAPPFVTRRLLHPKNLDVVLTVRSAASQPETSTESVNATFTLLEKISNSNGENAGDVLLENENLIEQVLLTLPNHSNKGVEEILRKTERILKALHKHSKQVRRDRIEEAKEAGRYVEKIYANSYVDFAKVDTVGFDFDYTLVTYTEELLEVIYDMALNRLVRDRQYPEEMLTAGLKYDPFFSIRGLAVDKETGWICHLDYTHKVRKKVKH